MYNFRPEAAYEELVGRKMAAYQLLRLLKLERVLQIITGDAVWALIIVFEFYDDAFRASALSITKWLKIVAVLLVAIIVLLIYGIFFHKV